MPAKKCMEQNSVNNSHFLCVCFFFNFLNFWTSTSPQRRKNRFWLLSSSQLRKLVQNDMSHAMLVPKINNFTAFENIVLKFDRVRRIFAVFRVYFAILIYGKCRDMVFQIPLTILHPLICDKPMLKAIVWKIITVQVMMTSSLQ